MIKHVSTEAMLATSGPSGKAGKLDRMGAKLVLGAPARFPESLSLSHCTYLMWHGVLPFLPSCGAPLLLKDEFQGVTAKT